MEDILARYLDGELTDAEATDFLRRTAKDPDLENALRDYETILASGEALPGATTSPRFADRVMNAITAREPSRTRPLSAGWPWFAAAATILVGFGIGFLGGRSYSPSTGVQVEARPPSLVLRASLEEPRPGVEYLRAVQLVYVATRPEVRSVAIAGSFNGWDPVTAPLIPEGDVWKVLLVLPPGTHEYMFIEDGDRWVTDPSAPGIRRDGFGGSNGVLNVSL